LEAFSHHDACIAPKVAEFLRCHQAEIYETWSFFSAALLGHRFAAMKFETDSLAHLNPFNLLARGLPTPRKMVSVEAQLDDKCAN
jgi:CDP-diacylglycerol pyrophosphatase